MSHSGRCILARGLWLVRARRSRAISYLVVMPVFAGIVSVGSGREPARRWQDHRAAWGEPAIDGKRLYVIVAPNKVVAFSLTSGREQWQTSIGVRSTILAPTIVTTAAAVIVADDDITGLDGNSGSVLWHVGLKESGAGRYLGATHGPFVFAGSSTGRLYAIDSRTGLTCPANFGPVEA